MILLSPQIPIRRRNFPHNVSEQGDGHIGDVLGEQLSGAGDLDSAAAALGEVDVVGSGAGGDDEAERGQEAEDVGGDGVGCTAENGGDGGRVVVVVVEEVLQ